MSIREHTLAYIRVREHMPAYVRIRQHTSAYMLLPLPAARPVVVTQAYAQAEEEEEKEPLLHASSKSARNTACHTAHLCHSLHIRRIH